MTKTHRKSAGHAEEAFNKHYASAWGEERWQKTLRPALLEPTRYVCVLNRYSYANAGEKGRNHILSRVSFPVVPLELPVIPDTNDESETSPRLNGLSTICFIGEAVTGDVEPPAVVFTHPEPGENRLLSHWNLDGASVLVAHVLNVQPGDNVLDLCAAPGGKSIVLAQNLWGHHDASGSGRDHTVLSQRLSRMSTLHCNEADGLRQRRLAENLRAYLPSELHHACHIAVLRIDGTAPKAQYALGVKSGSGCVGYDRVLVDAPCSSERHIMHAHARAQLSGREAPEMANWRAGSSKRLAETQLKLLLTGLRATRIGGTVVYATCSLEPTENDGVVEKMLAYVEKQRTKGGDWEVKVGFHASEGDGEGAASLEAEMAEKWAERTKYGWIVLPDHPGRGKWGPLFFSILTKVAVRCADP